MLKKHALLLLLLFWGTISFAQLNDIQQSCLTSEVNQRLLKKNPERLEKRVAFEAFYRANAEKVLDKNTAIFVIPVVIHVMSDGTPEMEITEEEIRGVVQNINENLRKIPGTQGDGNGVDMEIEIALAVRDPEGNCTSGITYHDLSHIPSYVSDGIDYEDEEAILTDDGLKDIARWDPEKYYNIYLVNTIKDAGAYAVYPLWHGEDFDGTVSKILDFRDTDGTTIAHELGHAFFLFHTFEGDSGGTNCPQNENCLEDGDMVCDTPPHRSTDGRLCDNPDEENTCDNDSPHSLFMHNHMSYSLYNCRNEFTLGQKTRAHLALQEFRSSFFPENGNDALIPVEEPNVDFYCENTTFSVCDTIIIDFLDQTKCIPNNFLSESDWENITFSWEFDNGDTTIFAHEQNPSVTFTKMGSYDVKLTVTSPTGQDTVLKKDYFTLYDINAVQLCEPLVSTEMMPQEYILYFGGFRHENNEWGDFGEDEYYDETCRYIAYLEANEEYSFDVFMSPLYYGGDPIPTNCIAYIDYNNNGVFEENELLVNATGTAANYSIINTTVQISDAAVMGVPLKMRVMTDTYPLNIDICNCEAQGGYIRSADYTVVINGESTLENKEMEETKWTLYPNPTSGILHLKTAEGLPIDQVIARDSNGKIVQSKRGKNIEQLNIQNLENGIYFIEIQTSKGSSIQKVIKI